MIERKKSEQTQAQPGGDESLDSLLRAVARSPSLPVAAASTISMTPRGLGHQAAEALPKVGTVLGGRYELLSVLGTGGMGAVYASKNLRTGKEVAIKVLLPTQSERSERVERFVREARAAGRIRHPNVVDVYDVEAEGDTPYLVMERLHGQSLRAAMQQGPLSAETAVKVVLGAMRGVIEAHAQGVIHRDLKPENIFLAREQPAPPDRQVQLSELVPKVLDFGVSRMLAHHESGEAPTTITRTGHVVGTPSYMALEQLRGAAQVDARADVYALGVILYEALAGKRPYDAQNSHELVIRMATEAPPSLERRAPGVDLTLVRIVMQALAREPELRHQSVAAFAEALERWLSGERTTHARRRPSRARTSTLVGTALILTLGGAALYFALRTEPSSIAPVPVPLASPAKSAPAPVLQAPVHPPPAPVPAIVEAAPAPPGSPGERAEPTLRPRRAAKAPDRATDLRVEDF